MTRPDVTTARALRAWEPIAAQLGSSPVPILALDREGRIVAATSELAGLAVTSLRGAALEELVIGDQRAPLRNVLQKVFAQGLSEALEVAIPPRGANEVTPEFGSWARLAFSPLWDPDHTVAAALVIAQDVTSHRREEARLRRRERLFVDTQGVAHFGVWEWSPGEPHALWSDEMYRIYGVDPRTHAPTYEDYLSRVHPDDRARVAAATENALLHRVPYSHDERIYRSDGELRYLHTWAEPVLDDAEQLLRLAGVCQDVTERIHAEHERDRLRDERLDETRRALELRDDFIDLVAHELRTPLTPLLGHLQLSQRTLVREGNAPRSLASVEAALRQVRHLVHLVDLLLDVSRVRAGSLELRREPCDLSDVVREVAASLGPEIRAAGCALVLDLAAPVVGRWDRARIAEVVTSLLSNAIKFGRGGPIEVSVTNLGDRGRLTVTNHGSAIEPSAVERIFEPYERAVPVKNYPGLGLGLYVLREIVRAHDGSISVESDAARGTSFTVELPRDTPAG